MCKVTDRSREKNYTLPVVHRKIQQSDYVITSSETVISVNFYTIFIVFISFYSV